jgi:glycosyltransferase involved in cell wall biosynthesis/GT2 family glycosyltransferase
MRKCCGQPCAEHSTPLAGASGELESVLQGDQIHTMRFLLSYSSQHFNPALPAARHEHWGSSANIVSRTLHGLLGRRGDVTFVDAAAPDEVAGQRFDGFVGIVRNFTRILEICEIEHSVLIAVNMHPAEHNSLLLDFVVREKLPSAALHELDLLNVEERGGSVDAADAILLFGNVATLNSYLKHGVPREKVRLVNYGSDLAAHEPAERARKEGDTDLLYCASEIGLRKGFDIVASAVPAADLEDLGAHLHIVGAPSYPYYRAKLEDLEDQLGPRISNHGWLAPSSSRYRELMDRIDFLFFPSLEEGQAGTVLDALSRGVIPLISPHCGIDFAPLGFCELEVASEHNVQLLRQACALPAAERRRQRAKALEYNDEFHAGYEEQLDLALGDVLSGSPSPQVSAVLPIHDKEPILADLLRLLDRALIAYGAADLCIILDGCTDGSEEIVRRFFQDRDDYPVEILTTPNIFEVRSNNLGLRKATGRYAMVVQDDNFLYDPNCIVEAVTFMEKSGRAAIVGGLAGVNFYPRGTRGLEGRGQIVMDENETYWRQDVDTDPALSDRVFQVDACMRGPLFFSKAFLDEHGYLDEAYAPLYSDDMDICFRAASVGRKVYCILMDAENDSFTVRGYDAEKARWLTEVTRRNTNLFYSRWEPTMDKDYLWLHRTRMLEERGVGEALLRARQRARRRYLDLRKRWLNTTMVVQILGGIRRRFRG